MSRSIRIVARTNGVGIDRDVRILTEALPDPCRPAAFSHYRGVSPLRCLYGRRDEEETIIFLERVTARWLRHAGRYLLIPNQERFPARLTPLLRRVDHVLCKSVHAQEVFSARHPSVHFLGFTSIDRRLPEVVPDYSRFFHLAGGSSLKGTATLLDVWSRHPEWPVLTVVQHSSEAPPRVAGNVHLIRDYLPDAELRHLQNSCGVHLCPSRSEGWGHYIAEAMSCGAVTVTTDGPPMNEIVQPERGVLVPYDRSERRKLGVNYYVEPSALERAVSELIERTPSEKESLGDAAREWFERNDLAFRRNLRRLVTALVPASA